MMISPFSLQQLKPQVNPKLKPLTHAAQVQPVIQSSGLFYANDVLWK